MSTTTEQLDLAPFIGQRQATYRFDLIDGASGRPLGEIHPDEGQPPALSHDTSRTIARLLTSINLDRSETSDLDPLTMRVRPTMLIGGEEFILGTYIFSDNVRARGSGGRRGALGAFDLTFVVDQPTEVTTSFPSGQTVESAIAAVLAPIRGIEGYFIEPSSAALGSPIAWPASTGRGRILADLAALGGYFNPYMGHDSFIHVRRSFDPSRSRATFNFDAGGSVIDGTLTETNDAIDAPNRFIVIDNSNTEVPVVGVYDVPVTAPHSAANRGFIVAVTFDIQGSGITSSAERTAETIGRRQTLLERVGAGTAPDPRHDAYDVVAYDGHNWLEISWALNLHEGAEMDHVLLRAYDAGEIILT